jgi:proliferating cell nuclear antigen
VLEADPDGFTMRAEGDSRKAELKVEKGNDELIKLEAKDHVKSIFPIDYLKKFAKASKLSDTAVLQIGADYPMRLDYRKTDMIQLGFVLAPRIESE